MKKILFLGSLFFITTCYCVDAYSSIDLAPNSSYASGGHEECDPILGCGNGYPDGGNANSICGDNNLNPGDSCDTTGAVRAICIENNSHGTDVLSCAARECDSDNGWLLWFHWNGKKHIPYGVCREKSFLQQRYCEKGCNGCPQGEECVVWERDVPAEFASGRGGKVFFDREKEVCHCQKQQSVTNDVCDEFGTTPEAIACCELKKAGQNVKWENNECKCTEPGQTLVNGECKDMYDCKVVAKGIFVCSDGREINVDNFPTNKKEFKLRDHPIIKEVATKKDYCIGSNMTKQQAEEILAVPAVKQYVIEKLCAKDDSSVSSSSSDEVQQAKQKLESFFSSAASGKRDVWKDKDGNFNTKRLASDLTAGVVLGTVGGVVSGVVIKKKQIEKGFEALHCTVGGHIVADWGDTFTVGLNRYFSKIK